MTRTSALSLRERTSIRHHQKRRPQRQRRRQWRRRWRQTHPQCCRRDDDDNGVTGHDDGIDCQSCRKSRPRHTWHCWRADDSRCSLFRGPKFSDFGDPLGHLYRHHCKISWADHQRADHQTSTTPELWRVPSLWERARYSGPLEWSRTPTYLVTDGFK